MVDVDITTSIHLEEHCYMVWCWNYMSIMGGSSCFFHNFGTPRLLFSDDKLLRNDLNDFWTPPFFQKRYLTFSTQFRGFKGNAGYAKPAFQLRRKAMPDSYTDCNWPKVRDLGNDKTPIGYGNIMKYYHIIHLIIPHIPIGSMVLVYMLTFGVYWW